MANTTPVDYLPIIIQFLVMAGFVGTTIVVTHLLGPKRKTADKLETFECGIEVHGNARTPFSVKYFLVAILFVLFDVEIIFMFPWAVNFKENIVDGINAFWEMLIFLSAVLLGFIYVIKKGILKWD
ncbi:MAG: NADH-quinone oxidoreductase subunit A [Flavobacteriales bacterium]